MYLKNIILCLWLVSYVSAAPAELPPEKQQPTVIPIVSQSEEFEPNGTYKFSYETGNGIKREEIAYEKVLPKSRAASSNEATENEDYSDEIHVQQGSYSYTAPDGTIISLRYIADENGFQPIGDHLPKSPFAISSSSNSGEKSGRALKSDDSSVSASGLAARKVSKADVPQVLNKANEPPADVAASSIQDLPAPAVAIPVEADSVGAAPTDASAANAGPGDVDPTDVSPANALPADVAPASAAAVDATPADAAPANAGPADAGLADTAPADAGSGDAAPAASTDAVTESEVPADAAPIDIAVSPQNAIQSEDKLVSEGEQAVEENNDQSTEATQQGTEAEPRNASDASPANIDVSSEAASLPVPVQPTESEQGATASAEQAFISTSEPPASSELSEPSSSTLAPEQSSSTEAIGQSSSTEVAYQPSAEEAEQSTKSPQSEEPISSTVSD